MPRRPLSLCSLVLALVVLAMHALPAWAVHWDLPTIWVLIAVGFWALAGVVIGLVQTMLGVPRA